MGWDVYLICWATLDLSNLPNLKRTKYSLNLTAIERQVCPIYAFKITTTTLYLIYARFGAFIFDSFIGSRGQF